MELLALEVVKSRISLTVGFFTPFKIVMSLACGATLLTLLTLLITCLCVNSCSVIISVYCYLVFLLSLVLIARKF